jgi:hypothetical protein
MEPEKRRFLLCATALVYKRRYGLWDRARFSAFNPRTLRNVKWQRTTN